MLSSGDVSYCVDLNAYYREVRDQLHTYSLPLSDSDAGSVAFCLHFDHVDTVKVQNGVPGSDPLRHKNALRGNEEPS